MISGFAHTTMFYSDLKNINEAKEETLFFKIEMKLRLINENFEHRTDFFLNKLQKIQSDTSPTDVRKRS